MITICYQITGHLKWRTNSHNKQITENTDFPPILQTIVDNYQSCALCQASKASFVLSCYCVSVMMISIKNIFFLFSDFYNVMMKEV